MPVGSNWLGDDHPTVATLRNEGLSGHRQATAEEAAIRGWYYRRGGIATNPMEPDTRRCTCHGEVVFDALPLTSAQAAIRHPLSPNVLLGKSP
jgi:hypothetical protein